MVAEHNDMCFLAYIHSQTGRSSVAHTPISGASWLLSAQWITPSGTWLWGPTQSGSLPQVSYTFR